MPQDNNQDFIIQGRARDTEFLGSRLTINESRGKYDLNDFIFSNLQTKYFNSILDLGCGRGKQLFRFLEENPGSSMTGVDISQESLQFIREKLGENANVQLVAKTAEDFLAGNKDKFDLIISSYALYYVLDLELQLQRIKNSLTSEGEFCVVGPYGRNNHELFSLVGYENLKGYVVYSSARFMVEIIDFVSKNFSLFSIATMINPIGYTSVEEVMTYWQSSTFYKESLRERVLNKLQEHFKGNELFVVNKYVMLCSGKNPIIK